MRFVCYTSWEQLPESANALFEQGAKDSIFFSRSWFECLSATAMGADHSIVLACVVSGNKVMAILPLMESTGNKTWYALRHGFTPQYSLLLANDDQERTLACLARALHELPVIGLLLEPVADDDSKLNRLQRCLEIAGFQCEHMFRHYNWILRLHGQSYEAYMAARPAQLRNTIARKKRKLEREHGYEIRLFTGDEVPQAMPDYYVVYHASWKQNEISNAGFQDCFVEDFSMAGWSRLAILYIKGQPVAAQLWFVHHDKASIFRLAYDKAWRQYSTGSILTSFLMEYVIETDKVREIDFLTGNDAYKQDWMSERRERFLLSCVKNTSAGSKYERIVESLKQILTRR
jgi:ribosomal protein S18 acetylase RimI-like enzyme